MPLGEDANAVEREEDRGQRYEDEDKIQDQLAYWWMEAREFQRENRYQCMQDHNFYHGLQWSTSDAEELRKRGQYPFVFNRIKPAVDWILGTEKKSRLEWKVNPRSADDVDSASVKTETLKYVEDVNLAVFNRSRAFEDSVIGGIGWVEAYADADPDSEIIGHRYEDWRNMWYDPFAYGIGLADARYMIRAKWLDIDTAKAQFPKHADRITVMDELQLFRDADDDEIIPAELEDRPGLVVGHGSLFNSRGLFMARPRVRMLETWWRDYRSVNVVKGAALGTLNGMIYDGPGANEWIDWHLRKAKAEVLNVMRWVSFCSITCAGKLVSHGRSPYHHNKFPFIPIIAYMRHNDRATYGTVRMLRDPQMDLNKRRSAAMRILTTRRVIMEKNAVESKQELYDQVNRPDGIIEVKRDARFEVQADNALAQEHVALMEQDAQYIQDVSGVTDENMGRETNAQSGRAVEARQMQGVVVTAKLFDSLRFSLQREGEIFLSLVEQYFDEEKVIRITGGKDPKFITINEQTPDGRTLNDITASKADFMVDVGEYSATSRRAMFESLLELVGRMPPEVGMRFLDMVVELSDVPNREEMVERVKQALAPQQSAPPDPEAQARAVKLAADAELAKARTEETRNKINVSNAGVDIDRQRVTLERINTLDSISRPEPSPASGGNGGGKPERTKGIV